MGRWRDGQTGDQRNALTNRQMDRYKVRHTVEEMEKQTEVETGSTEKCLFVLEKTNQKFNILKHLMQPQWPIL